jgi:transposase
LDRQRLAAHQKKAKRNRALILFLDETGLSVIPLVSRTWAPRGQTPILHHNGHWDKVSAITAVSPKGHLFFQMKLGAYDGASVIAFLRQLLRQVRNKIVLVWDNGKPHRSKETKAFLAQHRDRLLVEFLPPYAPELNPVEPFNNQLKNHNLKNYCPDNTPQLFAAAKRRVRRIRRNKRLVRSFMLQTPLKP